MTTKEKVLEKMWKDREELFKRGYGRFWKQKLKEHLRDKEEAIDLTEKLTRKDTLEKVYECIQSTPDTGDAVRMILDLIRKEGLG